MSTKILYFLFYYRVSGENPHSLLFFRLLLLLIMKLYLLPLLIVGGVLLFFGETSTVSNIEEVPVQQAKNILINSNNFVTNVQLEAIRNKNASPIPSILLNNVSRISFTYLGLAMCHHYFPLNDPRQGFVRLGITLTNIINIMCPHLETKYMFIHESAIDKNRFLQYKENKASFIADSIPREYNGGSGCMVVKVTSQNPSMIYRPLNLFLGFSMIINVDEMINLFAPEKNLEVFFTLLSPALLWTHTYYHTFAMNSLKGNSNIKFLIDGSKKE
jgi:hypothetical protein